VEVAGQGVVCWSGGRALTDQPKLHARAAYVGEGLSHLLSEGKVKTHTAAVLCMSRLHQRPRSALWRTACSLSKRHSPPQAADTAAGFANAAVRRGFMRKVLLIVLMQLVVTAGISLVFYYVTPLKVPAPERCAQNSLAEARLRSMVSMRLFSGAGCDRDRAHWRRPFVHLSCDLWLLHEEVAGAPC